MSETNLSSVDITKTWCDTERILEGLQPAVKTLMSSVGVQYESAAALIIERIQRVARNCRLARAASESLSGVPRSSAAGSSSQEIEASEEIDGADGMLRIEEDEAGTQEAAERTGQRSDAGDANHSNPLLDKESGKDASMPYGGEQQPRKHHQAEGHVDRGSKGKGPTKTAAQVQRHQFEAMRPLKRKDVQEPQEQRMHQQLLDGQEQAFIADRRRPPKKQRMRSVKDAAGASKDQQAPQAAETPMAAPIKVEQEQQAATLLSEKPLEGLKQLPPTQAALFAQHRLGAAGIFAPSSNVYQPAAQIFAAHRQPLLLPQTFGIHAASGNVHQPASGMIPIASLQHDDASAADLLQQGNNRSDR